MTKRLEMITLKEAEMIEENGEHKQVFINEKKFPAAITNYSMHLGEKLGLIKSSNITDLADLDAIFRAAIDPKVNQADALKGVDTTKYLKVIYLSIMGVNPGLELTYEQFTHLYHEDIPTTIEIYGALVLATMPVDQNAFADGFKNTTKKK
ncbi:putative aldehyde dehydrogenase [Bacillus sp. TS-2]|nr:putative aldehyde dehydrogenase [Bacillus sp. TS-2]